MLTWKWCIVHNKGVLGVCSHRIKIIIIDALRLILGHTISQYYKGSLHSQTKFYLGCGGGEVGGCRISYNFVCTIFLY